MDGWAIPETITAGTIAFLALVIVARFLGQRTDPKLLELFELQTKANSEREKAHNTNSDRLSKALDRNTEILDTVTKGIENVFISLATSFKEITETISSDHAKHEKAIHSLPGQILPTIKEITQQLQAQKGSVEKMNDVVDTQNGAIQQILDAILRLEKQVTEIGNDVKQFKSKGDELEINVTDVKLQIETIKQDVQKLTSETKAVEKTEQETKQDE